MFFLMESFIDVSRLATLQRRLDINVFTIKLINGSEPSGNKVARVPNQCFYWLIRKWKWVIWQQSLRG